MLTLTRLIESMRELVEKFPGGYEEWESAQIQLN